MTHALHDRARETPNPSARRGAEDEEAGQILWIIYCHNEWCSGPLRRQVRAAGKPTEEQRHCPVCGWLAWFGQCMEVKDD